MKHVYFILYFATLCPPPTTLCCSPGQDDERVSETMLVGSSSRVVMVGVSHRPQVNWSSSISSSSSSSSSSSIKIYACNVDCFIMAGHHPTTTTLLLLTETQKNQGVRNSQA